MTPAEHMVQRAMVAASLGAVHHPDVYGRRCLVPGANAEPTNHVESQTRVYARRPEEAGSDGSGAAPTPRSIPATHGRRHA